MTMFTDSLKASKAKEDFSVRTSTGGWLSLCSLLLIISLFISELWFFMKIETRDQVRIGGDLSLQFLKPHLDITFPKLPCAFLGVNIIDSRYANIVGVHNMILMQRIDINGRPLPTKPIRDSLRDIADSAKMSKAAHERQHREIRQEVGDGINRCSSCFDPTHEDQCCRRCTDIETIWEMKGKNLEDEPWTPAQCAMEYMELGPLPEEGCRITATLDTKVLNAHLNIGINYFYNHDIVHEHYIEDGVSGDLDFRHTFNELRFGERFPTMKDYLAGIENSYEEDDTGYQQAMFLYDVNVIPMEYSYIDGSVINSAVYSANHMAKSTKQGRYHLKSGYPPGVRMHLGVPAFTVYEAEF